MRKLLFKFIRYLIAGLVIIFTVIAAFFSYHHIFYFLPSMKNNCLSEDFNPESYGSSAMYCDPVTVGLSIKLILFGLAILCAVIYLLLRKKKVKVFGKEV